MASIAKLAELYRIVDTWVLECFVSCPQKCHFAEKKKPAIQGDGSIWFGAGNLESENGGYPQVWPDWDRLTSGFWDILFWTNRQKTRVFPTYNWVITVVVSETTYQLGCTSIDFPELIERNMHRTPLNIWIVNPWFLANFFKRPSDHYLSEQFNAVGLGRSGRYLDHNMWLLINIETESPSFIDSPSGQKNRSYHISLCSKWARNCPPDFSDPVVKLRLRGLLAGACFPDLRLGAVSQRIILWLDHEDRTYLYITYITYIYNYIYNIYIYNIYI